MCSFENSFPSLTVWVWNDWTRVTMGGYVISCVLCQMIHRMDGRTVVGTKADETAPKKTRWTLIRPRSAAWYSGGGDNLSRGGVQTRGTPGRMWTLKAANAACWTFGEGVSNRVGPPRILRTTSPSGCSMFCESRGLSHLTNLIKMLIKIKLKLIRSPMPEPTSQLVASSAQS